MTWVRLCYFHAFSGMSGDMTVGALVDAGAAQVLESIYGTRTSGASVYLDTCTSADVWFVYQRPATRRARQGDRRSCVSELKAALTESEFGCQLEVKPDASRNRARRNVMRSAEGGKEVVERFFVGQIDHRQPGAHLESVAAQNIVMPDGDVEKIAGLNARRVVVVVLGARRRESSRGSNRIAIAGQRPVGLIGVVGVACTLPQ